MTLFDWFVPGLSLALMVFLIWCAGQDRAGAERQRMVRSIILVGCVLQVHFVIAMLLDKGVRIPGALVILGFPPMGVLSLIIYLFVCKWDERFPEATFPKVAARVLAGLAAYVLVPWLVLGTLQPMPGHHMPPASAIFLSSLLGMVACVAVWFAMWFMAKGGARR